MPWPFDVVVICTLTNAWVLAHVLQFCSIIKNYYEPFIWWLEEYHGFCSHLYPCDNIIIVCMHVYRHIQKCCNYLQALLNQDFYINAIVGVYVEKERNTWAKHQSLVCDQAWNYHVSSHFLHKITHTQVTCHTEWMLYSWKLD